METTIGAKSRLQRRYAPAEKEQAVCLVWQLRKELGTVMRVARQLGYGAKSVRNWVRQADIYDGNKPGTPLDTTESPLRRGTQTTPRNQNIANTEIQPNSALLKQNPNQLQNRP